MKLRTHTYKGQTIYPCESAEHRGRWIVQAYHKPTGMPWADQHCAHHATLADARESIDWWLRNAS